MPAATQHVTRGITIHVSQSEGDPEWDNFLQSTALGQFQQSSYWGQFKSCEGWQAERVFILRGSSIVGGFQVLIKRMNYVGDIGYITKGPVVVTGDTDAAGVVVQQVKKMADRHRLQAVIVQPPDHCTVLPGLLAAPPFSKNRFVNVIDANLVVDLNKELAGIVKDMRGVTRKQIGQAQRRGVYIREGGVDDAGLFFELMLASCARQGSKTPNPSRKELVSAMWSELAPYNHIRLTFADFEGETLAGLLCIPFGERVTLWKKGWKSIHSNKRPNILLYYEAVEWALANGYSSCDFAAISRETATNILSGAPLSERAKKSRDFFNMGFGGTPVLLPESRVYIPNPMIRAAYDKVAVRARMVSVIRWLKRSLGL